MATAMALPNRLAGGRRGERGQSMVEPVVTSGGAARCRRGRGERGQSVVEFGLILVPLVLVLLGAVEGGRLLFTYNEVNDAARAGARYAVAHYTTVSEGSDANVSAAAKSAVDSAVQSGMTCILTKDSDDIGNYADVACSYNFATSVKLLPFTKALTITSHMYVP